MKPRWNPPPRRYPRLVGNSCRHVPFVCELELELSIAEQLPFLPNVSGLALGPVHCFQPDLHPDELRSLCFSILIEPVGEDQSRRIVVGILAHRS
jgi:hypothetical protein